MAWQWTPYTLPLLVSTVTSAVLSAYAGVYARRRSEGVMVPAFSVMMAASGLWSLTYLVQLSSTSLSTKLLAYRLTVAPYVLALSFLAFAAAYTDTQSLLDRRVFAVLSLEPAAYVFLGVPTDFVTHLIVDGGRLEPLWFGGPVVLDATLGPWYWVNIAFTYVVLLTAIILLVRTVVRSRRVYRGQAVAILVAVAFPLVANVLFLGGVVLDPRINLTPVSFTLSGIALGVALFRYELLDLVPVARDTVIDSMRDGYVVIDDRDRVVDANPAARNLLPATGALVGRPASAVLPDPDLLADADEDGRTQTETVVEDGDGNRRYVEVDVSPLSGEDRSIGRLVTLRDVTDRRAVEKRYQALIEHSSDVVSVLEPDGTATYQSPSVRRVFGYDPDEMVGTSVFEYVHPEDRERIAETFAENVGDPEATVRVEYRFRHADGEYRVVESVGRNLLEDPFVSGIVVNTRDVTERKEREEELAEKNERLEEFASVVSHDLRNPLAVAKGYLEPAYDDPETFLPEIETSLDRMEAIIEDVLTLARQGEDAGETVPVDLGEIAQDAWGNVETPAATLDVGTDRQLQADPDRLKQLFENLFRNAVEHGGEGVTVRVGTIDAGNPGDGDVPAGIYVADDGPGIPEDRRDAVLESGFTTADDGTGFGLAIVDRIADAHGWSVTVDESDDGGARFEIAADAPDDRPIAVEEVERG